MITFFNTLFNSQERQQPSYFEDLDQLYEFLQTAGKKPVYMSQKTLDTLQTLKDEYEQNDVHEQDPIGHFVERQAVKLGLHVSSGKWTFFFVKLRFYGRDAQFFFFSDSPSQMIMAVAETLSTLTQRIKKDDNTFKQTG